MSIWIDKNEFREHTRDNREWKIQISTTSGTQGTGIRQTKHKIITQNSKRMSNTDRATKTWVKRGAREG